MQKTFVIYKPDAMEKRIVSQGEVLRLAGHQIALQQDEQHAVGKMEMALNRRAWRFRLCPRCWRNAGWN